MCLSYFRRDLHICLAVRRPPKIVFWNNIYSYVLMRGLGREHGDRPSVTFVDQPSTQSPLLHIYDRKYQYLQSKYEVFGKIEYFLQNYEKFKFDRRKEL